MIKDREIQTLVKAYNALDTYLSREENYVGDSRNDGDAYALYCKARLVHATIKDMLKLIEKNGEYTLSE